MPLFGGPRLPGDSLPGLLYPPDASPVLLGWPVALEEVVNDAGRGPVAEFPVNQVLDCGRDPVDLLSEHFRGRCVTADNGKVKFEDSGRGHDAILDSDVADTVFGRLQ